MKHPIRGLSLLMILLALTACNKAEPEPVSPAEPEAGIESPVDQTYDEPELSVFDGVYRDCVTENEGEDGYVQITAYDDFILLEHYLCMDGSVYSFWAEEFWPYDGGYHDTAGEFASVFGQSQTFSVMTTGDLYDTMPQNRSIALTDEGVVLNYDDSDAEYYVKDEAFSYHSTAEEFRQILGGSTADSALLGTWGYWDGWETGCVTFGEDGHVSFLWKAPGEPVQVYHGVFALEEGDGVSVLAEMAGDGTYPHTMNWQWSVDEYGDLCLTFEDEIDRCFYPVDGQFSMEMSPRYALSYLGSWYDMHGAYTDQYGTDYDYIYRLPQFYGDAEAVMTVNRQIMDDFSPLIEMELQAMAQEEFLSYYEVDWESGQYEGVLYLHIYAECHNWQEHRAYYYDLETGAFLTTEEVLDRLLLDHDYFLEAVREGAGAVFTETFGSLPKEDRQEFGYYEMLEWTQSDEAVNFNLPIFVDDRGSIAVYARIGSMAGAGEFRVALYPFDGAVG